MAKKDRKALQFNRAIIRQFWLAMWKHRRLSMQALLLPISVMGISTLVPYFASRTLSAGLVHEIPFWSNLGWLMLTAAISIIVNRTSFNAFVRLQAMVIHELYEKIFSHLMHRSTSFHTNNIGGKLVSDATDYPGAYTQVATVLFTSGGPLALTFIVGLTIIFVYSWPLGVYLLGVVAVTLYWAYRESLTRHTLRTERLKATKAHIAHLSDSIVNATTVKTFAAEEREMHTNAALSRTLRDLRIKDWQRSGTSGSNRMGFLLASLVGLFIVVYLFVDLTADPNGLSTSIFAFTYTMTLIMRLFDINNLTRQIEESLLQASPVAQMLLEETEIKDAPHAEKLLVKDAEITFDNVSFAYTDDASGQKVFSKLSLHINPGEHVGIVGPSGGGKTTFTRLLLRFDDVQDGGILIDGQNIREVTQTSLRDAVGYVPQEPLLFHRSIRENIAYGKPRAGELAVQNAAKLAYAHEFITKLSKGYDTVVGERGVKLSGGQRQRIAIARAILKNAPILVLDEATSALDSESEGLIQDAMFALMKGKTAIVIAHRLSTIQRLDRIIVLNEGEIAEQGSHNELLKKKDGLYARLWTHQSGGFLKQD